MSKIKNKDVLQSYILTTAKYDFSVYEKRILYRIVEMNQHLLEGKGLTAKYEIESNLFGDKTITMPVACFLSGEDDKNYNRIKKAFMDLQKKILLYEDSKTWASLSIIANPVISKYSDTVTFNVNHLIYDAFLNFSKGFRKYELKTAMEFESVYSMRFYELMSGQKSPIEYGVDKLKEMFKIEAKYERVNDFFRKVIEPAKKELDEKSPYSFDYIPQKTGRKITSIMFIPRYQTKLRDKNLETKDLQKKVSLSWDLPRELVSYLKHNFEFTTDGIKNNIEVLKEANESFDIIAILGGMKAKIIGSNNPQGYIIGIIKKLISQ